MNESVQVVHPTMASSSRNVEHEDAAENERQNLMRLFQPSEESNVIRTRSDKRMSKSPKVHPLKIDSTKLREMRMANEKHIGQLRAALPGDHWPKVEPNRVFPTLGNQPVYPGRVLVGQDHDGELMWVYLAKVNEKANAEIRFLCGETRGNAAEWCPGSKDSLPVTPETWCRKIENHGMRIGSSDNWKGRATLLVKLAMLDAGYYDGGPAKSQDVEKTINVMKLNTEREGNSTTISEVNMSQHDAEDHPLKRCRNLERSPQAQASQTRKKQRVSSMSQEFDERNYRSKFGDIWENYIGSMTTKPETSQQVERLMKKVKDLQRELSGKDKEIQDGRKECLGLEEMLLKETEKRDAAERDKKSLEARRKEIEYLRERGKARDKDLVNLRTQLAEMESSNEERAALEEENERLKNTFDDLNQRHERAEEELAKYKRFKRVHDLGPRRLLFEMYVKKHSMPDVDNETARKDAKAEYEETYGFEIDEDEDSDSSSESEADREA